MGTADTTADLAVDDTRKAKSLVAALIASLAFVLLFVGAKGASADPGTPPPSTARYLVTFAPGVSAPDQLAAIAAAGASDGTAISELRMHAVDATDAAVTALETDPNVAAVEPDTTRSAQAAPSDPEYPQQWSLARIGWDQVYGSFYPLGNATVAVLDTGIAAGHPDLSGQLVPGASMIDGSDGTTDPNGHGTWMAGIVAAATDNGIGIAGVGYSGVHIMPVTVLGPDGTGQDSDIINGVIYAADHGADVILMSFSNPGYSDALQSAID